MSNEIEIELDDDLDLQEPKKYKVFLLNDDYSTMDFVIDVLVKVFRKSVDESANIMLNIHNNGRRIKNDKQRIKKYFYTSCRICKK